MANTIENVVLIVADALRPDRIGAYSGSNLTPNIDRLAKEGEVFEQTYSCINTTDPSVTTILTGQYPTRHGVINHGSRVTEREQNNVSGTTPISKFLQKTHYTVSIDTLERWHQRGFDDYINPRVKNTQDILYYLTGYKTSQIARKIKSLLGISRINQPVPSDIITDLAIESIEGAERSFFAFVHYWESHIPYVPMEEHPQRVKEKSYSEEEKVVLSDLWDSIEGPWKERLETEMAGKATTAADLKKKYDAGVWKVDQAVGELINQLKQKGIFDETAIIITADHGESLTEHGIFFDHHGLYDPSIHVPLIIKAPRFNGKENEFVQHYDLAPTILDLLNIDYEDESFDGVSLCSNGDARSLQRDAVYIEEGHTARKRAIRTDSYKYIHRLDEHENCRYCGIKHGANEELYNLEIDPSEQHNIINENPEIAADLRKNLESWIDNLPSPSRNKETFEPSDEVKNHLEEMGYI